jgi:hypothetical protein
VLVRLDRIVPSHACDGLASSEEGVAGHVTPGQRTDTLMFTAVHPNPFAIHQGTEKQRPTASALAYSENVEFMVVEPLKDAIQMQLGSDDVIIVQQEDQLCFGGIDCRIASDTHTNVVFVEVNHTAVRSGLRILHGKPKLWASVINNHNSWVIDMFA